MFSCAGGSAGNFWKAVVLAKADPYSFKKENKDKIKVQFWKSFKHIKDN